MSRFPELGDRWKFTRRFSFAATLTLAMTASTILVFAFGSLAPFIMSDLELGKSVFGTLTATIFLVGVLGSYPLGHYTDGSRGRLILVAVFAISGSGVVVAASASSPGTLMLASAITGIGLAAAFPATNQLISVHVPSGLRGWFVGIKQSGVHVGGLVAGFTLPPIADVMGWRSALLAAAGLALLGVVLALVSIPRHRSRERLPRASQGGRIDPFVRGLAAATFFKALTTISAAVFLPLYAFEEVGFDPVGAGALAGVLALLAIVSQIVWSRFTEHLVSLRLPLVFLTGLGIIAILLILLSADVGAWALWAGIVLFGMSLPPWGAVVVMALVKRVPLGSIGRASAVVQSAQNAGFVLGPVLFGWIADRTVGYTPAWTVMLLALVMTVVALFSSPDELRTRPLAPTSATSPEGKTRN